MRRIAIAVCWPSLIIERLGQDVIHLGHTFHAITLWALGNPDAAGAEIEALIETSRSTHPYTLAFDCAVGAAVLGMRRDWPRCEGLAAEAEQISEEHGFPLTQGVGRLVKGWSRRTAVEEVQQGMTIAGGTGNQALAPMILGILADTCRAAGRDAEAVSAADLGLSVSEQTTQHLWTPELLRLKGESFLRLPDHADSEAEALFREAIEMAQSQEAKSLELRTATSLARLW
jgi:predicted ATPase